MRNLQVLSLKQRRQQISDLATLNG
jgi:hypothetical protein